MYYFVPRMIKFYLGEEPILPNVETYLSSEEADRKYILENLENLVVKAANESGGYGMLIGTQASKAEIEKFRELIIAHPRNYIAQPVISLSRSPAFCDETLEGRHIDLRPYILYGEKVTIIARRPDARGDEERLAGGQLLAGRGEQGYLGSRGVIDDRYADRRYYAISKIHDQEPIPYRTFRE